MSNGHRQKSGGASLEAAVDKEIEGMGIDFQNCPLDPMGRRQEQSAEILSNQGIFRFSCFLLLPSAPDYRAV
jgi:hypothetical protein